MTHTPPLRLSGIGRGYLAALIAAAVSCSSRDVFIAPRTAHGALTLRLEPAQAQVVQGASATFTASVQTSGAYNGSAFVSVTGAPNGVSITVSNIQQVDRVITATVRIDVGVSSTAGTYSLMVHGTTTALPEATAVFILTVNDGPAICPPGSGPCEQWAVQATASTEYTTYDWSAAQATGAANVVGCADDTHAWASLDANGTDWLELVFTHAVRPTEIRIYENWAPSSIVNVEVRDESGTFHPVYTAQPERLDCPRVLSIPVASVSVAVNAVRISFDQRMINDWNEIDAVRLIGIR